MTLWIRAIIRWLDWLIRSPKPGLERPRFVGMYLQQANDPGCGAQCLPANSERRDGKYAQNRQRG